MEVQVIHSSKTDPIVVPIVKKKRKPTKFNPDPKEYYSIVSGEWAELLKSCNLKNGFLSTDSKREDILDRNGVLPGETYILGGESLYQRGKGTGLTYDERMLEHLENFHEVPERLTSIWKTFQDQKIENDCVHVDAKDADMDDILLCHDKVYVDALLDFEKTQVEPREFMDNDVVMNDHTMKAASLATGSVVQMTEKVITGELENGMVICRPPGHHAENSRAMGFCFYNNVAIAASVAMKKYNLERILIVDFDVHHGNGIQHIFENDKRVIYFSSHEFGNGYYPGTGAHTEIGVGEGKGFTINVPFDFAYGDSDILSAFHSILLPIALEFNPQLVLVSAGFDAVINDPLGGCKVSPEAFGTMIQYLKSFANGKMVLALEGGYNHSQTALSAAECLKVLLGRNCNQPPQNQRFALKKHSRMTIFNCMKVLSPYWKNILVLDPHKEEEIVEKIQKLDLSDNHVDESSDFGNQEN